MKTTDLYANRGWDRTDLDPNKLATLAFSIKTAGWQDAHPVVYETLPNGRKEIKWGHRRTLAATLAAMSNGIDTVEGMVEFIEKVSTKKIPATVCPVCGDQVDDSLEHCQGCNAALWAEDTTGEGNEPTFLGVAGEVEITSIDALVTGYNDFIHQIEVEVPAEEAQYVDEITSQLSLIQDGLGREDADIIGLSKAVARAVALGAKPKTVASLGLTDNEVQSYLAIAQLPEKIGQWVASNQLAMSIPRMVFQVTEPNQRQALINQLYERITVATVDTYVTRLREFKLEQPDMLASPAVNNHRAVIAAIFTQLLQSDPVKAWETVIKRGNVDIPENITELVPQVKCETCPLRDKMRQLPLINAAMGGYACQKGDAEWCVFHSEQVVADYRVRGSADVTYDNEAYFSSFDLALAAYSALTGEVKTVAEEDSRPIDKQREVIATFIKEQAEANGREHALATTCDTCAFKLTASPVKSDSTVPHCAWAGKRSTIEMGFLVDEKGYAIPRCMQYAPVASFSAMIPETDPGTVPEVVLDRLIDQLAGNLERNAVPPLRRLTGVPFSASEQHADWFRNRLKEASLSAGQKATLVTWLMAELDLDTRKPALLQLPAGRVGSFTLCDRLPE